MPYKDFDAFLDTQELIRFTYKRRDYEVDPDIPFPALLRAFQLMKEFGGDEAKAAPGAVPINEDQSIDEIAGLFEKMSSLMEVILGAENWKVMVNDRVSFRAIQAIMPWVMTQVTDSMGDEETPMTPEDEEMAALAAAGEGKAPAGVAQAAQLQRQTFSGSSAPSSPTSPASTESAETT